MKLTVWQQSLSALTIAGLTAPFMIPAAHAQSSLVGQTRCAKLPTAIFAERSPASIVVRSIGENQSVTIAENAAQGGFLAISAPVRGFVQTVTLRTCPTAGNPNPTPNPSGTCRRVTQTQGLLVRRGPDVSSPLVGSVAFNSQIDVSTTPTTSRTDSTGRVWVQIAKPFSGWVSNGLINAPGSNLVNCR
jgi:hypothetical protein